MKSFVARRTEVPGKIFPVLQSSLLLALSCLLLAKPAQALEVRAAVDKTEATLEDQIVLTVAVSGERSLSEQPELPPLPDFTVAQGGKTSHTEILNGQIRSSVEFTYLLTPHRAGSFTIGPIRVRKKGQGAESLPIRIRILPAQAAAGETPPAFAEQDVDVRDPYVSQQIVYTFRFLRRVQTVEAQWDPPAFQGFWVEDLGKELQYQKVLGGHNYLVTEIKKALYPLSAGSLEIPGTSLTCKLVLQRRGSRGTGSLFGDDFFRSPFFSGAETTTRVLRAEPVRLRVRPLPEAARPADFSGLVGAFSLQAELGQERLRVGDSTTLTLTVAGQGNLRDLAELPPQELSGFKIYPDKPTLQMQSAGDALEGVKVFKKALVPLEEGNLEIPSIGLAYFDPAEGAYRTVRTPPLFLAVERAEQAEQLHLAQSSPRAATGAAIQLVGRDILPIHTGLAGAGRQLPARNGLWLVLTLLIVPPGAVLACYGAKRRKERLEEDSHVVRRKRASRAARKALQEARRGLARAEDPEFYGHLSRSLRGLIGDKLNLSALAFTPEDVYQCLVDRGIETDTVRSVQAFLQELEYLQFGSTREEAKDRETRLQRTGKILRMLDRRL